MDKRVLTEVLVGNKIINLDSRVTALTTSAKVQLFPDPNTGIRITDGVNDVFKCITGGADVGDVILGSATGQHIKWDKSAGKLIVKGELAVNTLTGTELKATANLTVGTSNDVVRLSGDDSTYRIWVGHATAASAPFRITKAGAVYMSDCEIIGGPSKGVKSSTDTNHFEMGKWGAGNRDIFKGINEDGQTTVTWYADDGSGWSILKMFRPGSTSAYLGLAASFCGYIYDSNNYAAIQESGTGYPELLLKGNGHLCKIEAETGYADMAVGYKVNGTVVVRSQGAAVADATDAASTMARLNDLLARCRAHGLIAT